jgi:rhodanese-related sulfurtransferase
VRPRWILLIGATVLGLLVAGCGDDDTSSALPGDEPAVATGEGAGVRVVGAADGAAILEDPPPDLMVLDVRTPEEFEEGHLAGATLLDFYAPDFADRLAELDPDRPYLLYCRSGNRSGQARQMMIDLGFTDVADVDGGIVAWTGAGLPVEP